MIPQIYTIIQTLISLVAIFTRFFILGMLATALHGLSLSR